MFYQNITPKITQLHSLPYDPELLVFRRKETNTHIFFYPDTGITASLTPMSGRFAPKRLRLIKDMKLNTEFMLQHLNLYPYFHLIHPQVENVQQIITYNALF